jgi:anti-sigma factor RsiW
MQSRVTCRELVESLADYLDGRLPPAQQADFNVHLDLCRSCASYRRTYRQTIRLSRGAHLRPDGRVPESVPEELVQAILAAREEKA